MTPLRRLILATVAILVGICGNPVGLQAAGDWTPYQPAYDRMYWKATMNRWWQNEPGGDAWTTRLHSASSGYRVQTVELWFREEYSDGARRMVMEQGKWSCSVSGMYYEFPDLHRESGGPDDGDEGKLDLKSSSATVNHFIDKSSGKKFVEVSVVLRADVPEFNYQYFRFTLVPHPTVRIAGKVTNELLGRRISLGGKSPSIVQSYTDGDNVTLREHVPLFPGDETWIVRGTSHAETPELVLEPIGYDDWWPVGGRDEKTPGNAIAVKATLRAQDGGPPRVPAKRIRFELNRILGSREPGVSLNWPPVDQLISPAPPDFQIDPDRNPQLLPIEGSRRQKARTADGEHLEATVVISAYDWGAFGRLRAVADLTTGGSVDGHLKDEPGRTEVLLPKRQDDSRIADRWKERADAASLADDSDDEDDPVGNGFKGDGLSLYEEYRGFHEKGEHVCGVPKKKDLFLLDEIGTPFSRQGITLFETVSGLRVHHRLRRSELADGFDTRRIINVNHKSAHLVDQHALVLKSEDPGHRGGLAVGGPGVPRKVKVLQIHPELTPFFQNYSDADTLAHEMLHGVKVWHHGERDGEINGSQKKSGWVYWQMGETGERFRKPFINEFELDSSGNPIPSTARRVYVHRVFDDERGYSLELVPPERYRLGMKVWVAANQGGQHSGEKKCLMTYDVATAVAGPESREYLRDNIGPHRTLVRTPPRRTLLCDSPQGTRGTSRFGDVDSNAETGPRQRGTCAKQICVNDKCQDP